MTQSIHILSRGVVVDDNHLLLATTTAARGSFYFLPGGHIHHNESAEDTLRRELKEELDVDIQIKRFLGILEYSFKPHYSNQICHTHEYNLIFEVSSPQLKLSLSVPQNEPQICFEWIPFEALNNINLLPESLKESITLWLQSSTTNIFYSRMVDKQSNL